MAHLLGNEEYVKEVLKLLEMDGYEDAILDIQGEDKSRMIVLIVSRSECRKAETIDHGR